MGKKRVKAVLHGLMEVPTQGTFQRIIYMDEVSTSGQMEGYTRVLGSIIKCMDMVFLHGQMVGGTRVNI
jgi:hypothetical protein